MALSQSDKKEIEQLVRKEIKDFLGSTTINQYEKKFIDTLKKELTKGSMRTDINQIIADSFSEFYYQLWSRKSQWISPLKNVK
jgi:hypothetical protein